MIEKSQTTTLKTPFTCQDEQFPGNEQLWESRAGTLHVKWAIWEMTSYPLP